MSNPCLLLLDEPLANLDRAAARQCLGYLQRLATELELPMVYVSHDIEEVSQLADHLLLLEGGQRVDQGSMLALCNRLDSRLSQEEQAAAIAAADRFGLASRRSARQSGSGMPKSAAIWAASRPLFWQQKATMVGASSVFSAADRVT